MFFEIFQNLLPKFVKFMICKMKSKTPKTNFNWGKIQSVNVSLLTRSKLDKKSKFQTRFSRQ